MPNIPICVCVVIQDGSETKVLATTRRYDHTKYGLPGGKVDPEDFGKGRNLMAALKTAAVRELREETGVVADPNDLFEIHTGICRDETGKNPDSITFTFYTDQYTGTPSRQPGEPPVAWVEWDALCEGGAFSKYNREVRHSLTLRMP